MLSFHFPEEHKSIKPDISQINCGRGNGVIIAKIEAVNMPFSLNSEGKLNLAVPVSVIKCWIN